MQRNNYSSYSNNREDCDGDDDSYSSSQGSDQQPEDHEYYTPPQNSSRRPSRRPRPQETHSNPESSVSFFAGASNFEINGGSFTHIGGSNYDGAATQTPWNTSHRPSASRSKTTTTFFPNAQQFKINHGNFMAVNGDMHSPVNINVNGNNQRYPSRGPQIPRAQPQYGAPPNRDYPDDTEPSGRRDNGARRSSRRQDNSSSHRQSESSSPNQSYSGTNSTHPSFPSAQFPDDRGTAAHPQPSGREPPSHSAPPSSNTLPLSMQNVEPRDQTEMLVDRVTPSVSPSTGTFPTESADPNNLNPHALHTSVSAPPSFPRFGSTMIAETSASVEQESPAIIQGPAGNRDNVAPGPSGSNVASTSSAVPQVSSSEASHKQGNIWKKFGKKSEKDKEKK